jgi:hypothetical protein
LISQQADHEAEIPEEIRKHLAPWRQTLLEIMDKVKAEREKEKITSKQRTRS